MGVVRRAFLTGTIVIALLGSSGWAVEQRCTDLVANCLCSEPLNTTVGTPIGNYYNPGDSTTKECTSDGTANYPIFSQLLGVTASSSGTPEYTALPSGHRLTYVWRNALMTGISSGGFGPENVTALANVKDHMAARWYMYLSPDVNHESNPGGCHGSKFYFIGNQAQDIAFFVRDYWGQQNWLVTNLGLDCCGGWGPHRSTGAFNPGQGGLKGRWTRFELVIQNAKADGLILWLFIKRLGLDSTEGETLWSGSGSVDSNNFWGGTSGHPTAPEFANMRLSPGASGWQFRKFAPTLYREWQSDTTSCDGYAAFTHMMVAGWDGTYDSGTMRIGAASEVEGSGGVPGPPAALRISVVSVGRFVSIIGFILLGSFGMVGIVLGMTTWLTRRMRHGGMDGVAPVGSRASDPPPVPADAEWSAPEPRPGRGVVGAASELEEEVGAGVSTAGREARG